jgi:adenosylcobinamide-phosphate synthase
MNLLALLAALMLERLRPPQMRPSISRLIKEYTNYLQYHLNAGERRHGKIAWLLAVLPAVLGAVIIFKLAYYVHPVLGWTFNVLALYFTISFRPLVHHFTAIYRALLADRLDHARGMLSTWCGRETQHMNAREVARAAIEQVLLASYHQGFGVVLWFALCSLIGLGGASGALLYRLAYLLNQHWGISKDSDMKEFSKFSRQAYYFLNWLPLRLSALTFALVGNFEDALYGWRTQAANWPDPEAGILLASGAASLGVRLGNSTSHDTYSPPGLGEEADIDFMQSATGLIWRTLAFILVLLLLLTLTGLLN